MPLNFQNIVLMSLAVWDMTSVVHQDQCVMKIVYVPVTQRICTLMGTIVLKVSRLIRHTVKSM